MFICHPYGIESLIPLLTPSKSVMGTKGSSTTFFREEFLTMSAVNGNFPASRALLYTRLLNQASCG